MERPKVLHLEKFLYVSTLSDFGGDMLRLDIVPGDYNLFPFQSGHVLAKDGYIPQENEILKVFNTRDGDKGMAGTYHCDEITNKYLMRLYRNHIYAFLHEDFLDWLEDRRSTSDGEYFNEDSFEYDKLKDYNNIPVLFYLNHPIIMNDLKKISLDLVDSDVKRAEALWKVIHKNYGEIGVAVQQKELINMMGDQAGIAFFYNPKIPAHAIGNYLDDYSITENLEVFYPRYKFVCPFKPCNCDVSYKKQSK